MTHPTYNIITCEKINCAAFDSQTTKYELLRRRVITCYRYSFHRFLSQCPNPLRWLNTHFDKYMHWWCPMFVLLIGMTWFSETRYAHSKHFHYIHVFAGCLTSQSWKFTCCYRTLWFTTCYKPFTGYENRYHYCHQNRHTLNTKK